MINYILVCIKADGLQFGAPIVTEAQLKEGKRQLERHKRSTERTVQRVALREHLGKMVLGGAEGGFFASMLGKGGARKKDYKRKGDVDPGQPLIVEPEALSGLVEKKGGMGKKMGAAGTWKDLYAEVRSPGTLFFFKDQAAAAKNDHNHEKNGKGSGEKMSVELRLIVSCNVVQKEKKGADGGARMYLELSEDTVNLRFKDLEEAERWKTLLMLWKDYSIDYASLYGDRGDDYETDLEAGKHKKK